MTSATYVGGPLAGTTTAPRASALYRDEHGARVPRSLGRREVSARYNRGEVPGPFYVRHGPDYPGAPAVYRWAPDHPRPWPRLRLVPPLAYDAPALAPRTTREDIA